MGVNPGFIYYIYYLPDLTKRDKSQPITDPNFPKSTNPKAPEYLATLKPDDDEVKEWTTAYRAKVPKGNKHSGGFGFGDDDFGFSAAASSAASSAVEESETAPEEPGKRTSSASALARKFQVGVGESMDP